MESGLETSLVADNVVIQRDAPLDLAMGSWPPNKSFPPLFSSPKGYVYDQLGGVNTYIYVIDNGIEPSNAVSVAVYMQNTKIDLFQGICITTARIHTMARRTWCVRCST